MDYRGIEILAAGKMWDTRETGDSGSNYQILGMQRGSCLMYVDLLGILLVFDYGAAIDLSLAACAAPTAAVAIDTLRVFLVTSSFLLCNRGPLAFRQYN